jgi:hypothetical protein
VTASRTAAKHAAATVRASEPCCAVRSDKKRLHVQLLIVQLLIVPLLFEHLMSLVQYAPKGK